MTEFNVTGIAVAEFNMTCVAMILEREHGTEGRLCVSRASSVEDSDTSEA
jgi:hypothetical protein